MLLAMALDRVHPALPTVALGRIGGTLPQLGPDVLGRGDAGGGQGQLAASSEEMVDRCRLAARREVRRLDPSGLGEQVSGAVEL